MRMKLALAFTLTASMGFCQQSGSSQAAPTNPYDSLPPEHQLIFYKAETISLTAQVQALEKALKAQQDAYDALQAQVAAAPAIQNGNAALKQANDLLAKITHKTPETKK